MRYARNYGLFTGKEKQKLTLKEHRYLYYKMTLNQLS